MIHRTTLSQELKRQFGEKVYKLSLTTGYTCPTRDGTKGEKGCYYCGETGSHFANKNVDPIPVQIANGKTFLNGLYGVKKFVAFFQAFTSTYGPLDQLDKMLAESVQDPDIVGLNLSTRPDCLGQAELDVLAKHMLPRYHWLELGLESGHNHVLDACGRAHTVEAFDDAYQRAKAMGFRVCVHVILGLPGETEEMIIQTIKKLRDLDIDGIKFHNLHIVKNSVFEEWYRKGEIKLYEKDEYRDLLLKIIPILSKKTIIHRLMGDAPKKFLIAPKWDKNEFLAEIRSIRLPI